MLYLKVFDGYEISYVNLVTGEKKFELEAGDVCVGDQYFARN